MYKMPKNYREEKIINKECPRCLTYKPFSDYKKGAKLLDIYKNVCSECREEERILNPTPQILNSLRVRMHQTLKGELKANHSMELIGCTKEELKQHLEDQFTEGMGWYNYGKYGWHIDHIKPCARFNLADPEEQRKCFHFTNLQPLWAEDNMKKHDKWSEIDDFMWNRR